MKDFKELLKFCLIIYAWIAAWAIVVNIGYKLIFD